MTDADFDSTFDSDHPRERPPGFRSWKTVYAAVFACFVVMVALLAVFTRAFT